MQSLLFASIEFIDNNMNDNLDNPWDIEQRSFSLARQASKVAWSSWINYWSEKKLQYLMTGDCNIEDFEEINAQILRNFNKVLSFAKKHNVITQALARLTTAIAGDWHEMKYVCSHLKAWYSIDLGAIDNTTSVAITPAYCDEITDVEGNITATFMHGISLHTRTSAGNWVTNL